MPLYQLKCRKGHSLDIILSVKDRDEPRTCQHLTRPDLSDFTVICGEPMTREIGLVAGSFPGADSWRKK